MNLNTGLVQKQSQKLVMTQDLRQSIELLALSSLELNERIQNELMENPLLEEVRSHEKAKTPELYSANEVRNIQKSNYLKETEMNWGDSYSIENPRYLNWDSSDRNQKYIESSTVPQSLSDHLVSQLRLLDLTEQEFYLGQVLISLIDEKGFITVPLEELAKESLIPVKIWEKVRSCIHEMDPIGIGAKDIQETLLIQAKILAPESRILHEIIQKYLNELEKADYKKIAKSIEISEEEVIDHARYIRKLVPYPASMFHAKKIDYIIPDVIVKETGEEFSIFINDEWIPKLGIVNNYKEYLSSSSSSEDKEYIYTKLNSANWLIRAVNKRRQTLYKTVSAIIDVQKDFFLYGPSQIKPLTLKDISERISLSESTVSRITTNKYVQTRWGIYELKWFFSSGIKLGEGNFASSRKIRELILEMIRSEDETNPLSDQDIVDRFSAIGIEIARRTVAKYRKIMKILPYNQRNKNHRMKD